MEKAIKRAVEGGWGGNFKPDLVITMLENDCVGFSYPVQMSGVSMAISGILLQPKFWQALGKVEGWEELKEFKHASCGQIYTKDEYGYTKMTGPEWYEKMYDLVDHISTGGNPEEFFNKILK